MTIYGCNFVLFFSFSMPRYFPCIILSGMAKISGWLHYFDECKKLVPCLDKFGVFKNCLSSAPVASLGDLHSSAFVVEIGRSLIRKLL